MASANSLGETPPAATAALVEFGLTAEVPLGAKFPREDAIHPLVDALGVSIAGSATPVADAVRLFLAGSGRQRSEGGLYGPHGALALGAMGHALDYDDSVPTIPGHPSVPVLAALVAMPPEGALSGKAFVDAYCVGVEVAAKVGKATGGEHYQRGWHATSTHGCLGAVAALGRLHSLDADVVSRAIGIAVSGVSGLQCNFGTMTKPLHAGFAAQRAVEAVRLAQAGATACTTALEAPQGYFDVYGTDASRPELLLEELGEPWTFQSPGVFLKRYPCCYATHRAIAAISQLRSEHSLSPEDVASVECLVPIGGLRPLRSHRPTTGLEGKFSLEYAVAAALVDGDVGLRSFGDEAVTRPVVQELIRRTRVAEVAECSPDDPEGLRNSAGTRGHIVVRLELVDGCRHEAQVRVPPGAKESPLTSEDVSAKFLDCLVFAGVSADEASGLLDVLLRAESAEDLSDVTTAVRRYCGAGRDDKE